MNEGRELLILLPFHDLEEVAVSARNGANSILTAWTIPWHPELLVDFQRIPRWFSCESPPEPEPHRLAVVPVACEPHLKGGWQNKFFHQEDSVEHSGILVVTDWLNRMEGVRRLLGREPLPLPSTKDFFGLGFAVLQIQAMTRRVRYASHLDLTLLEKHALCAAAAAIANDHKQVQNALQECFDLLAQERDHFFSGDPYLLELILGVPDRPCWGLDQAIKNDDPLNLLLSADQLERIAGESPALLARIRKRIAEGTLEVVGGWSESLRDPSLMTACEALDGLDAARKTYQRWLGGEPSEGSICQPRVFARHGGGIPADLISSLVEHGYQGAIVADFLGGKDLSQSEPKLIWAQGGDRLDVLTVRPLDAAQNSQMIEVGPRLGSLLDAGYVATGLLTHWPNQSSIALEDLRVASRWGLSLGKFVTASDFFQRSPKTYHHYKPALSTSNEIPFGRESSSPTSPNPSATEDLLATIRSRFCHRLTSEIAHVGDGLLRWATADSPARHDDSPVSASTAGPFLSIINPHATKLRVTQRSNFPLAKDPVDVVLGSASADKEHLHRLQVPGCGFIAIRSGAPTQRHWWHFPPKLAESSTTLNNGLMQVHIDPRRGSVRAVYLPNTRANLFSLRLVPFDSGERTAEPRMVADMVRIRTSNEVLGEIESSGKCYLNQELIGNYHWVYRLQLGSRLLEVEGFVDVVSPHWIPPNTKGNQDDNGPEKGRGAFPWDRYVAFRAAFSNGMATTEALVRDRRVSAAGRRYVSPLGLHFDLVSSRVTICGGGLPFHRRHAEDQFDTLVATRTGKVDFRIAYGFNLAQPVHTARAWIAPPQALTNDRKEAARLLTPSHHGYFLHLSPASIVLLSALVSEDGTTIDLELLETEGRLRNVKVTSCCPLEAAFRYLRPTLRVDPARLGVSGDEVLQPLEITDDTCSFSISPHGIAKVQLQRSPSPTR